MWRWHVKREGMVVAVRRGDGVGERGDIGDIMYDGRRGWWWREDGQCHAAWRERGDGGCSMWKG